MPNPTMQIKIGADITELEKKLKSARQQLEELRKHYEMMDTLIREGQVKANHLFQVPGYNNLVPIDKIANDLKLAANMVSATERQLYEASGKHLRDNYKKNIKVIEDTVKDLSKFNTVESLKLPQAQALITQLKTARAELSQIKKDANALNDEATLIFISDEDKNYANRLSQWKNSSNAQIALKEHEASVQKKLNQDIKEYREHLSAVFDITKRLNALKLQGLTNTTEFRELQNLGAKHALDARNIRANASPEALNAIKLVDSEYRNQVANKSLLADIAEYESAYKKRIQFQEQFDKALDKNAVHAKQAADEISKLDKVLSDLEGKNSNNAMFNNMVGDIKRTSHEKSIISGIQEENHSLGQLKEKYADYYKERISLEDKLGKIKDKSSKEYREGSKRLSDLENEMHDMKIANLSNQPFVDYTKELKDATLLGKISSGLDDQITKESRTLTAQLTDLKHEIGRTSLAFHRGDIEFKEYNKTMSELSKEYKTLKKAMKDVKELVGNSGLNNFVAGIKSHLDWMISGQLVEQLQTLPERIKDITVEIDSLKRKIEQNIEMTEEFETHPEKIEGAIKDITDQAYKLANIYGMKVTEVLDMTQIMSRRFKDPGELMYFTDLAMVMSKLDFVSPAVAAETLEAVVLSFGLTANQTSDFIDQFTVATHTMRINGEDLLRALQRSGPMLTAFKLNTAESVAMISTLSTTLGREGTYIGTALNGMFARVLNTQNVKFLRSIGIEFTKANGEMKTGVEFLREYYERYKTLDAASQAYEVKQIFGAHRFQVAESLMRNWELIEETLDKIDSKATRFNTFKVLRVQMDSYESQLNRINNAFTVLGYTIGEGVMPQYTSLLERVTLFIDELLKNDNVVKKYTTGITFMIKVLVALKLLLITVNYLLGTNATMATIAGNGLNAFSSATLGASVTTSRFIGKLSILIARFSALAIAIWGVTAAYSAYQEAKNAEVDETSEQKVRKIAKKEYEAGRYNTFFWANYEKASELRYEIEKNQEEYLNAKAIIDSGVDNVDTNKLTKIVEAQHERIEQYNKLINDSLVAHSMENVQGEYARRNPINKDVPSIEHTGSGDVESNVNGEGNKSKEDKQREKVQKKILDARVSQFKTTSEISQKNYTSKMSDIDFEQEIFGKTPKNISAKNNSMFSRINEIKKQIKERTTFIKKLNDLIKKDIGVIGETFSSSTFDSLKAELDETLGSTDKTSGLWIKEMMSTIGVSLHSENISGQLAQFKESGNFSNNIDKMNRGDIIYWSGSDDKNNHIASNSGIYIGGGLVRFVGANGVQDIPMDNIKGVLGVGSTGANNFTAEDLEEIGKKNSNAQIASERLKAVNSLTKINTDEEEKIKEIMRELKRSYLLSNEAKFEREKDYLNATEESALLDVTNKRNAFNKTVKINVQLDFAKKELDILERELENAVNDRKEIMSKLDEAMREPTDGMTEAELEKHETLISIYKTQLQEFEITEAQKVLAVKRAKQEIEDLEYQTTEKIRKGLHGVVNDLLIQGKSLKDIWNNLWTDLAEEALRALMGIQDGQQSTLGAIAAKAFGLDKATPEQKGIEAQTTATATNTTSLDANTRAIQGLTTSLANGSYADGVDEISKAALGMSSTISDTLSKGVYADSMDSISKDSMGVSTSGFASQGKGKSADSTMAALGILAAATSMSGSKKASKFASLLSIAIPFIGGGKAGGTGASTAAAGKGKKKAVSAAAYGGNSLGTLYGGHISHDGSIIGVTPLPTRYYHNGGNVGTSVVPYLKSDEVNAVLQTGEEVVSRKDRRSNELMSEQNKHMADAMQRMAEGSNTNVTFAIQAIDSKSVVQLLSENGDAIMNILRKQSAYGNGRI